MNLIKAVLAKIFMRKILCLKVEKRFWFVIEYVILNTHNLFLKHYLHNAAKTGYQYIFACKQINMFTEWKNEDSIYMVCIEQYLFRSR